MLTPSAESPQKPAVLIFRDKLLHRSERFVLDQGEALTHWVPHYAGTRYVNAIRVPEARSFVLNTSPLISRIAELTFKLFGYAPAFERAICRLNPLLIHAHFGVDGTYIEPLASRLGIPLIVTFHGYDITLSDAYARRSLALRQYLRRRERLKRKATLVIAVSDYIKNRLIGRGFDEAKIAVNYIGVDTQRFSADPRIAREPILLFVGRLSEEKGCEPFVHAAAKAQAVCGELRVVVIGNGPLRRRMESQAADLLQRYRFLGSQDTETVRHWMNRARVLCVPSIVAASGQSEAFGLVFVEAQAMGLPVVSFPTGGISEAVQHGVTGFLATPYDSDLLAKHITLLLQDLDLWNRFSTAAQERVRRLFDLRLQVAKLEELYRSVQNLHHTGS